MLTSPLVPVVLVTVALLAAVLVARASATASTGARWSDDSVTYYAPDLREVAPSAEVCEPPGVAGTTTTRTPCWSVWCSSA